MTCWNTIEEMFEALHRANCKYIILRNYEEIDVENFYTSGHADIDFLTENSKQFAKLIHARPRFVSDDGIHYVVTIGGSDVVIDTRSVGDGYYDSKWEQALLANRKKIENRFYIADDTNYYYSLVYHAILQKSALADDYLKRLCDMAAALGIGATTEKEHLKELISFMKKNGYYFTLPYDIHVPLRSEVIEKAMIKKQLNVKVRDIKLQLLRTGSRIKHLIMKN